MACGVVSAVMAVISVLSIVIFSLVSLLVIEVLFLGAFIEAELMWKSFFHRNGWMQIVHRINYLGFVAVFLG